MQEKNFGGDFKSFQNSESHAENAGNNFDAHHFHKDIPHIKAPGPRMGPDFLDDEELKQVYPEKNEKEEDMEKLEMIRSIILEIEIDLLSPAGSYKQLANELKERGLFTEKFKSDINLFFNQKLVYLYNKENLKNENIKLTEEERKKRKEAAFAGAKGLHDIIEKLEKIEENGGDDEKIREYWMMRKKFYLDLQENDNDLIDQEKRLLDSLQNAQKYGALAEKAARDLIKNASLYIKEIIESDASLRNLYPNGIRLNIKDASVKDDVFGGVDFYFEIITENRDTGKDDVEYFPVQVKCGSIDSRRGEDDETEEYIMSNLIREVAAGDKFECGENSCYYEKKTTDKLNKFIDKALVKSGYERGLFVILPRGKQTLKENGDVDHVVKDLFFKQFMEVLLKMKLNK